MTGAHMFPGDGFFWMGSGMGVIWAIVTGVLWIGFWALVVWLIVRIVRTRPPPGGGSRAGLHVLEERYARGEIGREEFLERRAVLRGEMPPG